LTLWQCAAKISLTGTKTAKIKQETKWNPCVDRDGLLHRCRGPRPLPFFMTVAYGVWACWVVKFWAST